ncbi:GNAT family N-acetyltransferase [Lachnospiraceae bacterium C1.1]
MLVAVAPKYQGQGIGAKLLERCLSDMKEKGIAAVNLITSNDKKLSGFYEKHGFKRENEVILMGLEI